MTIGFRMCHKFTIRITGDVIFIPAGAIHAVRNLQTPTVGLSMNYIDYTNAAMASQDLLANTRHAADRAMGRALRHLLLLPPASASMGGEEEDAVEAIPLWQYKRSSLKSEDEDVPSGVMHDMHLPGRMTAVANCRDRFLQPFASTSIWNTAIGSRAQFVHAHLFDDSSNVTCVRQPCGPPFSFHNDQDFIINSTESDPLTDWVDQGNWNGTQDKCAVVGKAITQIRFPASWTSASGGPPTNGTTRNRFYSRPNQMNNNAMAVLLPDQEMWVQMQPAYRCAPGTALLARFGSATDGCPQQFPNVTSALGDGVLGSHGGSGLSGVGGSIRVGELLPSTPPIRHALKLELQSRWYFGGYPLQNSSKYNGGRQQYHWPATGSDGGTSNCLNGKQNAGRGSNCTYSGQLPGLAEGSLLALPAVVAASVAVNTTVGAKLKAALTDYGGYIVDGTGDGNGPRDPSAAICMDAAVNDEMRRAYGYAMTYPTGVTDDPHFGRELYWDLVAIFRALHVVVNNGPESIGGGGTPCVPTRPPLC